MTTQHTPGPWSVTNGHYPSFKQIRGPSFKISVVMWATDLTEDDYRKRDADMHLIAAAPDLLDALNTWLKQYSAEEYEDCPEVVQNRAAIAKATGAQS